MSARSSGRRRPLYPRLLRLQHVHPNAWQRAALGEGALGVAALLVLADVATAWTLLVLPLAVAAVVKGHDLLAGVLGAGAAGGADPAVSGETVASPVARPGAAGPRETATGPGAGSAA